MPMTVGELKMLLMELPNDAPVLFEDPNFGGVYSRFPELHDFTVSTAAKALLITFPLENDVNEL